MMRSPRFLRSAVCLFSVFLAKGASTQDLPIDGLALWLDASDLDGDGNEDDIAVGEPITEWVDKIEGLTFTNADEASRPIYDELVGEPAEGASGVFFDGTKSLAATDLADATFLTDAGEAFVVFESTFSGEGYLLSVDGGGFVAFVTFPDQDLGFVVQDTTAGNNYIGDNTFRSNNGRSHLASVSTDGFAWEFFASGVGPNPTGGLVGVNTGGWFGDTGAPIAVTLGSFTDGDGVPDPGGCCEFQGRIAEILVYDHVLDPAERAEVLAYMADRYGFEPPVCATPAGLTATSVEGFIELDWDDSPEDIDGFNVWRSATPGAPYDKINDALLTESDYLDDDVAIGDVFYYVVTCVSGGQEGGPSNEVIGTVADPCEDAILDGAPDVDGLRFWLDGSDIDADPATDNPPVGEPVTDWIDKICGIALSQVDSFYQPVVSELGENGAGSVLFDDDFLIALDVSPAWFDDPAGSIVVVYTQTNAGEAYGFEVADPATQGFISTVMFADQNGGFGMQSWRIDGTNNYVFDTTPTADGARHATIVNADGAIWDFYTDGAFDPGATGSLAGNNVGNWYGLLPNPSYISLGQYADGLAAPQTYDHKGHFAEILIFDHPLDSDERDEIWDYIDEKYGGEAQPCPAPSGLVATPAEIEIALDWNDVDCPNLEGYNVYRAEASGGPYQKLHTNPMADSTLTDEDISFDVTYYYVVTAVGAGGESGSSNEASAVVESDDEPIFHRGDADDSGALDLTDGVQILNWLFRGSGEPPCLDAADADNSGVADLTDAIRILNYLFIGGPAPVDPGPPGEGPCGTDDDGALGCVSYTSC